MTATTLFALLGCHGKDTDGGTDGVPTESGLIEDSGELVADSGAEVDPCTETGEFTTTISGDVTVSLWVPGADGERESISFEESYDGTFPFGGIWITAYEEDSAGDPVYLGETVVKTPDIAGDAWSLTVTSEACREVWIHAVLDEDGNRVLDEREPSGAHPDPIQLVPGTDPTGVAVDILAQGVDPGSSSGGGGGLGGWGGGGWGSGGALGGSGGSGAGTGMGAGGWGAGDAGGSGSGGWPGSGGLGGGSTWPGSTEGSGYLTVSGDIIVTTSYAAGDVAALVYTTDDVGPLGGSIETPTSNGSGAIAPYSFYAPADYGDVQLLGAWDSDDNWLFDPTDIWGAYITAVDVDGNPLTIADEDIEADVQIPLAGVESPFAIVPYINLSGTVGMLGGGTFDDRLDPGATIYVAALKYKASTDASLADLEAEAYDMTSFEWSDLSGNSSVAFGLNVPANNIVYLWAYTDADGDGTLNEDGEAVGSSGSDSSGKNATGENDLSGISILLNRP